MDRPRNVAVIGAGMVGLSTAWHLQSQGVEVTVYDKKGVCAGSSRGNAGWLTPAIATPLPEPAVLRYGIKAVLSPSSPVYVPPSASPTLARFVAGFMRHSTAGRWNRAMQSLIPINALALDAFAHLTDHGVAAEVLDAQPFIAGYDTRANAEVLLEEFRQIEAAGGHVDHEVVSGEEARQREPSLSAKVQAAILIHGQKFINPSAFVESLADEVRARGADIREGEAVEAIRPEGTTVRLRLSQSGEAVHDAVVVATGAWLGKLAHQFGVRHIVQAGRGYSFSVDADPMPGGPIYLPGERVAITPLGDRLRVAGMMEFRLPDAPLDKRRIAAIVASAREYLDGVDLDNRRDEWVGSRPVTADGLPLIGRTNSERVFVAGGHGMWGITLGPITGELLARQVVSGYTPQELMPFDPLRRVRWGRLPRRRKLELS